MTCFHSPLWLYSLFPAVSSGFCSTPAFLGQILGARYPPRGFPAPSRLAYQGTAWSESALSAVLRTTAECRLYVWLLGMLFAANRAGNWTHSVGLENHPVPLVGGVHPSWVRTSVAKTPGFSSQLLVAPPSPRRMINTDPAVQPGTASGRSHTGGYPRGAVTPSAAASGAGPHRGRGCKTCSMRRERGILRTLTAWSPDAPVS